MKSDWDDPDNPVIGTTAFALGRPRINVRRRDQEVGELLGVPAEKMAIARQPIGHGLSVMDLAEDQEEPQ